MKLKRDRITSFHGIHDLQYYQSVMLKDFLNAGGLGIEQSNLFWYNWTKTLTKQARLLLHVMLWQVHVIAMCHLSILSTICQGLVIWFSAGSIFNGKSGLFWYLYPICFVFRLWIQYCINSTKHTEAVRSWRLKLWQEFITKSFGKIGSLPFARLQYLLVSKDVKTFVTSQTLILSIVLNVNHRFPVSQAINLSNAWAQSRFVTSHHLGHLFFDKQTSKCLYMRINFQTAILN